MSAFTFSIFIRISVFWIVFLIPKILISLAISATNTDEKLKVFPLTAFQTAEKLGWF